MKQAAFHVNALLNTLRLSMRVLVLLVALMLSACASQAAVDAHNDRRRARMVTTDWGQAGKLQPGDPISHPQVETFDEAMRLPDEEFDLAQALLLFARDVGGRKVDLAATLAEIDASVRELRRQLAPYKSIEHRQQLLRTYIHQRLGFGFDRSDPDGRSAENLYFDAVWKRRKGYCVTLSMVYLIHARGVGMRLAGVRLPGHFAVMSMEGEANTVLETTSRGRPRTRSDLFDSYLISQDAVDAGAFLTPLTDKELFSTVFNNHGGLAVYRGDDQSALGSFNYALAIDGNNIEALYNRSGVLMSSPETADVQKALADLNRAVEVEPNFYHGYCRRAELLHRFGRKDDAARDLRRARGIFPRKPYADVVEGVMRYRDRDLEAAKSAFEAALAKDGNNEAALRNLSLVEEALGNLARSQELRAKHARLYPGAQR